MKHITSEFSCLCEAKTKLSFKKPKPLQPSNMFLTCVGCETTYWVKFSHRVELAKDNLLQVGFTFEKVSDRLYNIMVEKDKANKQMEMPLDEESKTPPTP